MENSVGGSADNEDQTVETGEGLRYSGRAFRQGYSVAISPDGKSHKGSSRMTVLSAVASGYWKGNFTLIGHSSAVLS